MSGRKLFPIRECKSCGSKTRSTSTIDHCIQCGDNDGLRPRHFLTRDRDEGTVRQSEERKGNSDG